MKKLQYKIIKLNNNFNNQNKTINRCNNSYNNLNNKLKNNNNNFNKVLPNNKIYKVR